MYDFRQGKAVSEFVEALEDVFPFFRAFIDDKHDAEITMFLSTRKADKQTIEALEAALNDAIRSMTSRYPNAIPPSISVDKGYEQEAVILKGVSHILQACVHLQAKASAFAKVVHFGGNPTTL